MRGLPFSVNEQEIIDFFQGYGMKEDSIKLGKLSDGRLTGEAAVLFEEHDQTRAA